MRGQVRYLRRMLAALKVSSAVEMAERLARRDSPPRWRVTCGANLANGGQCSRMSEPGKKRCRYHGGRSTGPRTAEGKARAALNLPSVRAAAARSMTKAEPAAQSEA